VTCRERRGDRLAEQPAVVVEPGSHVQTRVEVPPRRIVGASGKRMPRNLAAGEHACARVCATGLDRPRPSLGGRPLPGP
jgi:hypothetical protein